jgi:S-DNA-T family DNA segregation ATPase FtsK/SpoIIIE
MLTLMPGTSDLKRVHCAFISEDEVKAVCDFLRLQGEPVYDDNILKPRDDEEDDGLGGVPASDDPLYDRAVALVARPGTARSATSSATSASATTKPPSSSSVWKRRAW